MSDIKLFHVSTNKVEELIGTTDTIEKSVQTFFEKNLEVLLGVRFLVSEFATSNGGRIDTLGLDENGCPAILEYKRTSNENVINQGLFYLDWLMDHRKDFQWLVLERLGKEEAEAFDWSAPRLICIAGDFNRYDDHAAEQPDACLG
jgi:RecB family endonuclease NucS